MDLIEICQRIVSLCQIADLSDRRDIAIHRINRLESDELGRVVVVLAQQALQIFEIVVLPDPFRAPSVTNAVDHGGVVHLVGENDATRQQPDQGAERGVVGDIAGGEEQRRRLAVKIGKLVFQLDVIVRRTRDIARSTGSATGNVDGLVHGTDHHGMLAHGEVVVAAPDLDVAGLLARVVRCGGKAAAFAADVGKLAVTALLPESAQCFVKFLVVVHHSTSLVRTQFRHAPAPGTRSASASSKCDLAPCQCHAPRRRRPNRPTP